MSVDITKIPTKELIDDKRDSLADIITCEAALMGGITKYSGGSVKERIYVNKVVVVKINKELTRRGEAS